MFLLHFKMMFSLGIEFFITRVFSLSTFSTSLVLHCFFACVYYDKKSAVILILSAVHVSFFSLTAFKILSVLVYITLNITCLLVVVVVVLCVWWWWCSVLPQWKYPLTLC